MGKRHLPLSLMMTWIPGTHVVGENQLARVVLAYTHAVLL